MPRLNPRERAVFLNVKAACYQGLGAFDLLEEMHEQLGPALRADATCTVLLDPDTCLPYYSVSRGWEDWQHQPLIENALLRSPAADPGRWIVEGIRAVHADAMVEESIEKDPYFEHHIFLGGHRYEALMPCATGHHGRLLFTVNRRHQTGDFEPGHMRLMQALSPHVAAGIHAATVRESLNVTARPDIGIIVLDEHGKVALANAAGEHWITAGERESERGRSWALPMLKMLLDRALAEDGDDLAPVLTVPDPRTGAAARLHAERTIDSEGRPRTMIVAEPARAVERPELLARLGLTPRESEIALAVVRGEDLIAFGRRVGISPHTVTDHLRNVYTKLGVSSRIELAGRLMAWA